MVVLILREMQWVGLDMVGYEPECLVDLVGGLGWMA